MALRKYDYLRRSRSLKRTRVRPGYELLDGLSGESTKFKSNVAVYAQPKIQSY